MELKSVDVLIVTAVQDERDGVLRCESDWEEPPDPDPSGFPFHVRHDPGGLTWALARAVDMGGDYAANIATRLVAFLKPRCLAMVGVCAGWRQKVRLGDVIVAERLFCYDAGKLVAYRDGSAREEEVFQDIRTYNLDPRWRQRAEDFPSDWTETVRTNARPLGLASQEVWLLRELLAFETGSRQHPRDQSSRNARCPDWIKVAGRLETRGLVQFDGAMTLTSAGRRHVEELRDRYPPDGFPGELSWPEVHIAPIATGGRVVEDEELFPTIHTSVRKTLGVDMEGAAIGAVAAIEDVDHCIVVKGVQDHADREKDDRYRAYAIETSYRFLIAFLRRHLPPKKRAPFILPQLPMGNFTGRNRETRALERILLHDGTARLCTIAGLSGTAGIGKSALAVHFSVVHRDAFPAGVIGLRVDGKELDAIAREFVRIAGEDVDPDDERDATVLMQSVFRDREALLIFDNADSTEIRKLVPGGRCAVIVTTRDRGLSAALELPMAARIDVPVLPLEEAIELLRRRLGGRVDADRAAAEHLATVVGRLPLALQIVAAALELDPRCALGDLAEILETERDRLRRLRVRGDSELDIRVSFAASLRFLAPEEVEFFACLGVCATASFAVHAAVAAAACPDSIARERLAYLHQISLVNEAEVSFGRRFALHPLLRDFARELAQDRGLLETARERHARHFIELVKLSRDEPAEKTDLIEDIEEALAAAHWMLDRAEIDDTFLKNLCLLLYRAGVWKVPIWLHASCLWSKLALTKNWQRT